MNRKVLIVDDAADLLQKVRATLCERFEVYTAAAAGPALDLCERKGPFAVVITDQGIPGMSGVEFLGFLQKGWPDTSRMIMTGCGNLDLAIEAVHEGAISRFLQKPIAPEDLLRATEAGVRRFRGLEEERLLTEQLQFSRESLLSLTETLERRLSDQLGRLRGMQRFAIALSDLDSLDAVATLAATTSSKLLGGRAVLVGLDDRYSGTQVEQAVGAMSSQPYVEPIRTRDGEMGFLHVDETDADGRALARSDKHMIAALAGTTASAAYNQIQRRARDVAHHGVIFALARLTENRDDVTGEHLERVSQYCRLIAEGLRADGHHVDVIDDAYVNDLMMSAPLHDIGKVGVPDSILLKPGPLTDQEWEVMRRHPKIGAETLLHVMETSGEQSFLWMAHEIAWAHHERWNGTGYPRQLRGEEIPLAARIMALADCYDALTTRRPYKRAWTHEEALAYVREQRGEHFDPDIIDAFERSIDAVKGVRVRLADPSRDAERTLRQVS